MPANFCGLVGAEYPIAAFGHCRDVVASGTRSRGFGVLGWATYSPDQLDQQLTWLDSQCGRRSYGVDLVFPILVRDATISAIEHVVAAAPGTQVGQIVGMMTAERSVTCVMDALVAQFMEATLRVCAVAAAGESA